MEVTQHHWTSREQLKTSPFCCTEKYFCVHARTFLTCLVPAQRAADTLFNHGITFLKSWSCNIHTHTDTHTLTYTQTHTHRHMQTHTHSHTYADGHTHTLALSFIHTLSLYIVKQTHPPSHRL
jgi:hypothetical protein